MAADPILRAFAATCGRAAHGAGAAAGVAGRPIAVSPSRAWSAEDLDRAARQLAERLAAAGFGVGDAVGLAAAPGPAVLAGYLALRRRGAVPVLCDSARPTPDRLAALDRLGVVGFLASAVGWPDAAADWDLDRRWPAEPGRSTAIDPRWGAIKLSSGSTGEPRGIATAAEALLADEAQLAATMEISGEDRLLAAVPLTHSYGFSSLALAALVRGATLIFADDAAPFAALEAGRALGATVFPTVPAWLGGYVRLRTPPPWPPALGQVIAAGAPLPAETARGFRERTGRPVHVFYGASECGGIAYDREGGAAERDTVGAPVEGVRLEIDPDSGRLAVRSAALSVTYLPEPSPDLGAGRFLTGDLAELGGEVRLLGRADDLVFVRGRNVNPREVEAVLRQLPGVDEVCVLGADGPDGPRSVLCAIVAVPAGGLDAERIAAFCRERLAEHKVPRSLRVVADLPRTERGKLDRAAVATLVAN